MAKEQENRNPEQQNRSYTDKELIEKYWLEIEGVLWEQSILYDQLADAGIISIIELATGDIVVLPKISKKADPLATGRSKIPNLEEIRRTSRFRPWTNAVSLPTLKPDGSWDKTLIIKSSQHDEDPVEDRKWTTRPSIAIRYTEYGVLFISGAGKDATFEGKLPTDMGERFDVIQEAFEKAMNDPKPGRKKSHYLPRGRFSA